MILRARIAAIGVALALGAGFAADDAQAERLIVSVSNHRVTVTPNYSGEELVLFGSVEKDDKTPANRGNYDLVVTVSGPRADMVTRRKERRFGIWVNNDYRQFLKVPTYLAIFSDRPFEAIAPPEVQRRQQLGLNNVPHRHSASGRSADRDLRCRHKTVCQWRAGDADRDRIRNRQGRLRTVRRHHGAPERFCLWPGNRIDGADDGLDGLDRVQEGLMCCCLIHRRHLRMTAVNEAKSLD
jgi:hypothetical protein